MTVVIQLENNIKEEGGSFLFSPELYLDDHEFIQLWELLGLSTGITGSVYGIKIQSIMSKIDINELELHNETENAPILFPITGLDIFNRLKNIVNAALQREEKIIWFYEEDEFA